MVSFKRKVIYVRDKTNPELSPPEKEKTRGKTPVFRDELRGSLQLIGRLGGESAGL